MQLTGRKTSLLLAIAAAAAFGPAARASLTFDATFDPSLTTPEQTAINSAITVIQSDITSPNNITVSIYFTSMTSGLGESTTGEYDIDYYNYYNAFKNLATQSDQLTALASLGTAPTGLSSGNPVNGNVDIAVTSAEARNLGFTAAPVVDVGGTDYDGEIQLNTSITSPGGGSYSLESVAMHEIDEVLGIGGTGSTLNGSGSLTGAVGDLDLYRYSGAGVRSYSNDSTNQPYFSIDGGTTALSYFNQVPGADFADWQSNPDHSGFGVQVQDAFATPGATPVLGVSEITAFNAIGYDTASPSPEPATFVLTSSLLGAIAALRRRAPKSR